MFLIRYEQRYLYKNQLEDGRLPMVCPRTSVMLLERLGHLNTDIDIFEKFSQNKGSFL